MRKMKINSKYSSENKDMDIMKHWLKHEKWKDNTFTCLTAVPKGKDRGDKIWRI